MSHQLTFATKIRDRELLKSAADRLRRRFPDVTISGPHYKEGVHTRTGKMDGYAVKLPGWTKEAMFACDETGLMDADNYSPYFDNRTIGPDGERVPGSGDVHPAVLSGEKRVGEDGRWGSIEWLERLEDEYLAAGYEQTAIERGDYMTETVEEDGAILLEIEVS